MELLNVFLFTPITTLLNLLFIGCPQIQLFNMTVNGPVHRDIENELLSKERKHRRPHGQAVYCFPYTMDMVDFDNWDFMFQTKYCFRGGLTMNQFETPPRSVLDLGCGGGLWIIEAAKQWKVKRCHIL